MFGYIKPEKPELKIKEYYTFKAFYCGVCKSIGKRSGLVPRATLSYDSTFLALLLSSISSKPPECKSETCILHPVKKRYVFKNDIAIDYAADMNIILSYLNLIDKWMDERLLRVIPGLISLIPVYRKLKRKYYRKCVIIEGNLKELSKLEKEKCSSVDRAAEPFANLMQEVMVFDQVCSDEKCSIILKWIGYNLGKWIYMLDAYGDIERDIRNNCYNPLKYQYNYNGESIEELKKRMREEVEFNLTYTLSEITKALRLLEIKRNKNLVENIVYMGMLRQTESILGCVNCKGRCSNIEKSI